MAAISLCPAGTGNFYNFPEKTYVNIHISDGKKPETCLLTGQIIQYLSLSEKM